MAAPGCAPTPPAEPSGLFDRRWPAALPDLEALPAERLEAEICTHAAHLDAALCRWLVLLGEYDRRQGWASWECRSAAQWLSWKCGISRVTATEHVRVGRALLVRPVIRHAFGRGEISYSKVRAITRIDEPLLDEELVDLARASTAAGLERAVRAYRRYGTTTSADHSARAHDQRQITWHFDDDGALILRGRLPADTGAVVIDALTRAHDERVRHTRTTPDTDTDTDTDTDADADAEGGAEPTVVAEPGADPRAVDTADDLVHLARRYLGHTDHHGRRAGHELLVLVDAHLLTDDAATTDGPATDGPATDGPALDDPAADGTPPATSAHVIVDPTAAQGPAPAATRLARHLGRTCELSGGTAISTETARRLACDATTAIATIDSHGNPLDLGRRHRVVNRRMRRALQLRDRTCQFPGCTRRGHLEAHHLVHWIHGGPTDLDNIALLCEHHHTRVHEGHWTLTGNPGQPLAARHRDGRTMTAVPRPPQPTDPTTIETDNHTIGLIIDHHTNEPEWEGRHPDLTTTIDALDGTLHRARQRHQRATPPPETDHRDVA